MTLDERKELIDRKNEIITTLHELEDREDSILSKYQTENGLQFYTPNAIASLEGLWQEYNSLTQELLSVRKEIYNMASNKQ